MLVHWRTFVVLAVSITTHHVIDPLVCTNVATRCDERQRTGKLCKQL